MAPSLQKVGKHGFVLHALYQLLTILEEGAEQ
jgi:hypothetical protein